MTSRTPESDCLLCKNAKATKTNSHLLPASLVATMVGARNKEESYTISPGSAEPVKKHFGRANLKNTNPVPSKDDNVVDYFFCPQCENRFGVIESEISPVLVNKIKDINQKQNFPVTNLDSGVSYVTCIKVNPIIFRLYLFSLIWRKCLQYRFMFGNDFLATPAEVEWFRKILNDSLGNSIEETLAKSNVNEIEQLTFVSCACLEEYDRTANAGLLHPNYRHPYCLVCNDYLFLFDFKKEQLNSEPPFIQLKHFKVDKRIINLSGAVKIALSKLNYWKLFLNSIWQQNAEITTKKYVTLLSNKMGISYEEAGGLINQKAFDIEKETGIGFFDCFYEAFNFYYNK